MAIERVGLDTLNIKIDPNQVKGSDGCYLQIPLGEDMTEEKDPRMQTVGLVVATFIAVCAVAILAAGTVKLILWMF